MQNAFDCFLISLEMLPIPLMKFNVSGKDSLQRMHCVPGL